MKSLDYLAQQLDHSPVTRQVFFRDDDGGWADAQLLALCEFFEQKEVPLDIAVIPKALTSPSVHLLRSVVSSDAGQFHLHQHGYAHVNHQTEGRSCEFGSSRNLHEQLDDIAQGQRIMQDNFQDKAEPIFTPPWNRCSSDTAEALQQLGFSLLSRITGSEAIGGRINELPVAVDWLKKKKGVRLENDDIVKLTCRAFEDNNSYLGIMLHHEHMDAENREQLSQLIDVLKNSDKVKFTSMLSIGASGSQVKQESPIHEST
ncbi:MAG: DUF2334 domain-containing protein [Granulosicoccus sp.]|nr:DUF2334 domain-containing protein [Granulosicoccus sp.]